MEAVVLAGGFGTRLRAVVADVPKPMAPVAGRPFLEILLTLLAQGGFTRVVLSLGYMAESIRAHFGDSFAGIELEYEIEDTPLGTGGATRQALQRCQSDHVFVLNGDTYLELEIAEIETLWQKQRHPIIVAREVPDTARYGRLDTADARVLGFREKGVNGPGLINAGCYVLPRGALDHFPAGRNFSLEADFFAGAVRDQAVDAFVTRGRFIDIGVPEDYALAQRELADRPR